MCLQETSCFAASPAVVAVPRGAFRTSCRRLCEIVRTSDGSWGCECPLQGLRVCFVLLKLPSNQSVTCAQRVPPRKAIAIGATIQGFTISIVIVLTLAHCVCPAQLWKFACKTWALGPVHSKFGWVCTLNHSLPLSTESTGYPLLLESGSWSI